MDQKSNFLGKLFQSRNIAHLFHLQTNSYAAHKASNDYYDGILDLIDGLIESHQGKYGIIKINIDSANSENSTNLITHLKNLLEYIEQETPFTDSDELNIIDEIKTLIKQTLYKLQYLE